MRYLILFCLLTTSVLLPAQNNPSRSLVQDLKSITQDESGYSSGDVISQDEARSDKEELDDLSTQLKGIDEEREVSFFFGLGLVLGSALVIAVNINRLTPKTIKGKKLLVLLPVAFWSSACFVCQAGISKPIIHPINAFITALLYAMPAFLFGAIGFWWVSEANSSDTESQSPACISN